MTYQQKERTTSIEGLKKIVGKVWWQVSAEYLEKLYESLLKQMEAVIFSGGSHTKYWKPNFSYFVTISWINELFPQVSEDFFPR